MEMVDRIVLKNSRTINNNGVKCKITLLIVFCIAIFAMVFLRDIVSLSINKYLIFIVATIGMFFFDKSHLIAFLGFIFSLTYGLPGTYIYAAAAIILIIKDHGRVKKSLILWLVFSFLEIILSVSFSSEFSITFYVSFVSRLFLLLYFLSEESRNKTIDYSLPVKLYIFGTIAFLIISILLFLKDGSFDMILSGKMRLGDARYYYWVTNDVEGLLASTNSNNIAFQSCAALACCILMFFKKKKIFWIILYGIIWVGTLLTTSQTFLIVSLLQILLWVILLIARREKTHYVFLFVLIAAVGLVVIVSTGIFTMLSNRLKSGMFQNDSGRLSLFVEYFNKLSSRPFNFLFGTGALYYKSVLQLEQSCHNGLQQIFISYGFFGFILFITSFVYFIYGICIKIERSKSATLISFLPLISAVLFTQTIQFFNPVELLLPFVISLFALRVVVDGNKDSLSNDNKQYLNY